MEQLETCVQDVSSMMFSHKFQIFQLFKNFSTSIWRLLHLKIWRSLLVSQETLPTAMWPGTFGVSRHLRAGSTIEEFEDEQPHLFWWEPWNFMTFHSLGNGIIIPTDELIIFFRGVG
jgi:hypothetical protein